MTRRGHVVWDSAACKPTAAKPVRFTLGVPQVLTIGLEPRGRAARRVRWVAARRRPRATLDAVAMSHGQSSPVRAFKLAG